MISQSLDLQPSMGLVRLYVRIHEIRFSTGSSFVVEAFAIRDFLFSIPEHQVNDITMQQSHAL